MLIIPTKYETFPYSCRETVGKLLFICLFILGIGKGRKDQGHYALKLLAVYLYLFWSVGISIAGSSLGRKEALFLKHQAFRTNAGY